ncbi:MAG TPA: TIGR03013 family XrtA/PEP-CTERM system glycosyltransferase, partial [Vicinamibacteria bacterium]|nr:TIGR03013 family XrtA/PEP-CTERM system glycosyltransferase [Vicinamibacteria bacterium]
DEPIGGSLLAKGLAPVLALQLSLYYSELYDDRALRSRTQFFLRLAQSYLSAALILALVFYLFPGARIGPGTLLLCLPISALTIFAWHSVHRWAVGQEGLIDNVLILGTGPTAQLITMEMLRRTPLGYHVVGFLGEHESELGRSIVNPSVIGTTADLLPLVESLAVSLIVIALEDRRGRLPVNDLLKCRLAGVKVEDAPDFFERLTGKILVDDLRPSWLVFSSGFSKPRLLRNSKRVVEFVGASLLALAFAPILALVALLIRLDSRGPALFRQPRVGLQGRVFELYKLRTMRIDAEAATGPAWASPDNDPRVTRVGRILRKLRLDELPQFFNVLKGDMSFVGPRPERPHFVEKLRQVIPYYDERHTVRPGITGWAQVKFGYGSTIEDTECKLQFDLFYLKNMSLFLDLAILLDTLKVMLLGRGAR